MLLREIDASETSKLLECITQLSEYHNHISVNFKGSFPSRPYEETILIFTDSLIRKELNRRSSGNSTGEETL